MKDIQFSADILKVFPLYLGKTWQKLIEESPDFPFQKTFIYNCINSRANISNNLNNELNKLWNELSLDYSDLTQLYLLVDIINSGSMKVKQYKLKKHRDTLNQNKSIEENNMRLGKKELFNTEEINTYIGKFENKLNECNAKIEQLKEAIGKAEQETDIAIERDILEDSTSSKKELCNISARKSNAELQLEVEMKKLSKIKEIMMVGLGKLVPEASRQIQEDLITFNNTVEKEVYSKLSILKDQQAELLLSLQVAHNTVINEIFSYNEICHFADLKHYAKTASNDLFQTNLFLPHRNYAEYGAPLLNCSLLPYIEEHLMRARADANAQFNSYKDEADMEQLPLSKGYADIDLQKFLSSLFE